MLSSNTSCIIFLFFVQMVNCCESEWEVGPNCRDNCITFDGRVLEARTGEPIANCEIKIMSTFRDSDNCDHDIIGTTLTNSAGIYHFPHTNEYLNRFPTDFTVSYAANGYHSWRNPTTHTVHHDTFYSAQPYRLDVEMAKKGKLDLTIKMKNPDRISDVWFDIGFDQFQEGIDIPNAELDGTYRKIIEAYGDLFNHLEISYKLDGQDKVFRDSFFIRQGFLKKYEVEI